MTWNLKNRELEKKLIAIDPDFVGNLQKSVKYHEDETTVAVGFGNGIGGLSRFVAEFRWDELEEVPEYNPKAWNEYPKVIPPKNVVMRCEIYTERYDTDTPEPKGGKLIERTSGVFDGFKWNLYSLSLSISENWTIRYRPWDED